MVIKFWFYVLPSNMASFLQLIVWSLNIAVALSLKMSIYVIHINHLIPITSRYLRIDVLRCSFIFTVESKQESQDPAPGARHTHRLRTRHHAGHRHSPCQRQILPQVSAFAFQVINYVFRLFSLRRVSVNTHRIWIAKNIYIFFNLLFLFSRIYLILLNKGYF